MLHKHNIFNGIWMIEDSYAANYLPHLIAYLKGEQQTPVEKVSPLTIHTQSSSLSGSGDNSDDTGSIAVISISGPITKHSQFCGPAGMQEVSELLEACFDSDDITGIVLKVESGGGDGMAMRLLNETIAKKNKPIVGFVEDFACSAAYGILSGCDYIVVNSDMARVGSIGTYLSIADYSKQLEKQGIDLKTIYATASKDKNGEVREAMKGNTKPLEDLANIFNEHFLSTIEKNREDKLTETREVWGTGKVYFAEDAIKLGLIDKIDTFTNTLNYFTWKS